MNRIRPLVAAASLSIASLVAASDSATLVVASKRSSVDAATDIVASMPGFLIGDWHAETNPGGTQTRPGLIGGSGNQPIDMTLELQVASAIETQPEGGFAVAFDDGAGTIAISELALDLLGGDSGGATLSVGLLYETFRTFAPDSLYFGGIPFSVPLGEATLTAFDIAQAGPTLDGTLVPTGEPGAWTFAVTVPITTTFTAIAFDQEIAAAPIPGLLPLAGTLTVAAGEVTVALASAQSIDETQPGPNGAGFADLPFELPTILPPGETAGILLTADLDSIATSLDQTIDLVARGALDGGDPADLNGDGIVGFDDLLILLGDWGPCAGCPADLDGNGDVGFTDMVQLLGAWTT